MPSSSPSASIPSDSSSSSASSFSFRSSSRRSILLSLALLATTLVLYAPVVHNDFINFDDDTYILNNPQVRSGLNWSTVHWSFTAFAWGNWGPLSWLSHALDCQLFGIDPGAHHLMSVFLHGFSAVVLFLLLQSATRRTGASLMVALLFALHPVNVESVAWAAERKNVLSMLFFLLALWSYDTYARRPNAWRYAQVCGCYVLALLSKPQVMTFPLLLLLWDRWPLGRVRGGPLSAADESIPTFPWPRLLLEKVPLLVLSLAEGALAVVAQRSAHALRTSAEYGLLNRIETALVSYVRYLGMALWPVHLAVFYPHPSRLYPAWQVLAAILTLALITLVVIIFSRRRPYLGVGWGWYVVAMLPMIGLVQVGGHARADRFAYIPFLGLFLIAVWLGSDWLRERHLPTPARIALAALILLPLALLTHRQIMFWHDSPTLWTHTLAVTDHNAVAHDYLSMYLLQHGQADAAVPHLHAALAIDPGDLQATNALGAYEFSRGNLSAAIERYKVVTAHATDPDLLANAYSNLGSAYRQSGDDVHAKSAFQDALRIEPNRPIAMVGLGLIALRQNDPEEALRRFSSAMAVQPTDVGYLLIARALEQAGRTRDADALRQRVRQLSPDIDEAEKQANQLMGLN